MNQKRYWLIGAAIGALVGIILTNFFFSRHWFFENELSFSMFIAPLSIYFIIGACIGGVYGKSKKNTVSDGVDPLLVVPNNHVLEVDIISKKKNYVSMVLMFLFAGFFIVITLIVLLQMVFSYFNIFQGNPAVQTVATTTTLDQTIQPATTLVQTANWETYHLDKYGFSFRYPPDWGVRSQADKGLLNGKVQVLLYPEELWKLGENPEGVVPGLSVLFDSTDLDPRSDTDIFNHPEYELKKMVINGYEAYYIKQTSTIYTDVTYILYNNNDSLNFTFRSMWPKDGGGQIDYTRFLPVVESIVQSATFTVPAVVSTAD